MQKTNCVNCGMPLNGSVCEYCGTKYSLLDADVKPLLVYRPEMTSAEMLKLAFTQEEEREMPTILYADNKPIAIEFRGWRWNEIGSVKIL